MKTAADKEHKREIRAPVSFDVKAITAEGLGKVRYVGAWAVKKVLCAEQKNVRITSDQVSLPPGHLWINSKAWFP